MDVVPFKLCNIHSVVLIVVIWCSEQTTGSKEAIFSKQTACKLQTMVSLQCVRRNESRFKSLIQCASGCAREVGCLGISTDNERSCFYHYECSQNITCSPSDILFEVYVRHDIGVLESTTSATIPQCQHNGVWNQTKNACNCNSGWVGQFCERYGTSCKELAQYGYPQGWPAGLIWATIQLTADATPVKVMCELRETFFNTYILRNDGWTDLRKIQPAQYMDGFNISGDCFWLGLNKMKAFNDAGYTTLKLDTGFTIGSDDNLFQMTFENFKMRGLSDHFKFTFNNIVYKKEGVNADNYTFGDCLTPLKGAEFASPDEDSSAENCAMTAGVGWWYNNACRITCNPLGYKKLKNPDRPRTEHIIMDGLNCESTDSCHVAIYFVMF